MSGTLGRWITSGSAVPFYARRKFAVRGPVEHAEAYVCGLGQFNFYVNGTKAGDHELDPAWSNYRRLVYYVTFDITGYLREGENIAGAEVGNGWYIKTDEHYTFRFAEFMPPNPNPYRPFGESLVLAVKIEIRYRDGGTETITADEKFQTAPHPGVMSNVYGSETIDRRVPSYCFDGDGEGIQWKPAVVLEKEKEPAGRLEEQRQPPVKVIQTYEGKIIGKAGNRVICDFGQNMSGILSFQAKGGRGGKICFYPAEKLKEDGDVDQYAKGWTEVDSCITGILGGTGDWEEFRMTFTYFAGRYMALETDGGVEVSRIRAHAVSSAWKQAGSFSCDDERYLQIYRLVEKAVEANMVSVHTDCPTIERFAWQEPNHLMAPSIMYMKDVRMLWEKFLLDMRTDQLTEKDFFYDYEGNKVFFGDGLVPSQCPCYIPNVLPVPAMGSFYDIIAWGSACILGTYWHYWFYGDRRVVEDNYMTGVRYAAYLMRKLTPEGFISHGLGDWGNPENMLARENVETVFLYADLKVLAEFAELLEKKEDALRFREQAEKIRENYNRRLLVKHPVWGIWCYRTWDHPDETVLTQAGQALPLYWGMAPEEKESGVVQAFRRTLEDKGAFISGEIGLPYIIQTARRYGMNDLIGKFILRDTHPSYYAFVLDGETTLGEYWEKNPRSHCHDMMGHIIEWYYNGIAGIIPEKPGFRGVRIEPYFPESIKEFRCSYLTESGEIKVEAKETDVIWLTVTAPERIEVHISTENLMCRKKEVKVRLERKNGK